MAWPTGAGNKGASHMYAVDMDLDGIADVVAADWAHGDQGLAWYKQGADGKFTKYYFMGGTKTDDITKWGAGFSEPHSLQVADMDGDGRPDVITGKMRFANPQGQGDPDINGVPVLVRLQKRCNSRRKDGCADHTAAQIGGSDRRARDDSTPAGGVGVGRQLAIGHANTDGVLDICVATKVGLAVFLGQ